MKSGTYPRTHSIINLLRDLSILEEDVKSLLDDKWIIILTKIEDAYIGLRYLPRRYEKAEVEGMLKFVKEVFNPAIKKL